jgi:hypothetical protein
MSHHPGTSQLPSGGDGNDTRVTEGATINPGDSSRFLRYGSQLSYTIKINRIHASGTNNISYVWRCGRPEQTSEKDGIDFIVEPSLAAFSKLQLLIDCETRYFASIIHTSFLSHYFYYTSFAHAVDAFVTLMIKLVIIQFRIISKT